MMRFLITLLLLVPIIIYGQRDIKPVDIDIDERNIAQEVTDYTAPYTGSGISIITDSYSAFQRARDKGRFYSERKKAIERKIYKKRHRNKETKYSFDLVFHNLSGMDEGLFKEEVYIQIKSLNRDFNDKPRINKEHPHIDKVAIPGFIFQLSEEGIVYRKEAFDWKDWETIKQARTEGSEPLPTDKYINIWVVDVPNAYGSYAQYPEGPESTDGIVIDVDFFGRGHGNYREGKTLSTLMAQFFGLKLLSSQDGCVDDGVYDTTVHAIKYRYSLPYQIRSHCDNQPLMTDNMMSHAPDIHRKYFTEGQVNRMKLMIDNSKGRNSLSHGKKSVQ